ncbi:DNA-directed RNA polymerase subunit omega [Feifania hominis]
MSMLKPAISELIGKDDSRYSLVIAVAKRARQIADDSEKLGVHLKEKPVKIAVGEFAQGKIKIVEADKNVWREDE